jgi:hypothetical protein
MVDYSEMRKMLAEYIKQEPDAVETIAAMIHCILKEERIKREEGKSNE